jgi:hypothetical protein
MILITRHNDASFLLTCGEDEAATIERLQYKYPRKLEKFIETYLSERKVNIREQENMLIMSHMSETERLERLKDIEEGN